MLASGHGALERALNSAFSPAGAAITFGLKAAASIICLGLGFRGGLFFASLLLGALLGQLYWWASPPWARGRRRACCSPP